MKRTHSLIITLLALWSWSAFAATAAAPRVSILTADPGAEIYQLEGHTALRLDLPGAYDMVVNWGVFDFYGDGFVYHFVKGETDYMAAAYDTRYFLEQYRAEGRRVTEQVLNLDSAQTARLVGLVNTNLLPQNRVYRYNYVYDNCATRPLALIEQALGDTLCFTEPRAVSPDGPMWLPGKPADFRGEMTGYHAHYPWYQLGIDLALGPGIDRGITTRERAFAPVFLRELLKTATLPGTDGEPLVAYTATLVEGAPGGATLPPTPWPLTPRAVAIYILAAVLAASIRDARRRRLTRWVDTAMFGLYGLLGCVLTFLIFASSHEATSPNWLYLWLNPLCLFPAVCVWIKSCRRAVYFYHFCNFAAVLTLLAGHRLMGQGFNPAFPWLMLADLARSATYIYVYRATR